MAKSYSNKEYENPGTLDQILKMHKEDDEDKRENEKNRLGVSTTVKGS